LTSSFSSSLGIENKFSCPRSFVDPFKRKVEESFAAIEENKEIINGKSNKKTTYFPIFVNRNSQAEKS